MVEEVNKHKIRDVVFILAIVILYIPTVQLATTTIIPQDQYTYPVYDPCIKPYSTNASAQELQAQNECIQKQQDENNAQQEARQEKDTVRFIFACLVSFITVLIVAFIAFPMVINYGLFIGSVVNVLFSLRFSVEKSLVGLILLVVLFIISIIFINKQLREK
jgi:hypothetical protein